MDLIQFQQNLLGIDVWELLKLILEKYLSEIEQMNKEQLSRGLLATGDNTPFHSGSQKSEIYVEDKIDRGVYPESLYPKMNFYNRGDFYRSITAFLEDDGITIDSNDDKVLLLEEKYSPHLLGLTKESLSKLTSMIVGEFRISLLNTMLNEN
jgi:hypothetical protein